MRVNRYAEYSLFRVGSEKTNFRLTVAGFTGNASDSFSSHNGTPFSTIDRTHDKAPECCPCAKTYASGWWFTKYSDNYLFRHRAHIHLFQLIIPAASKLI
jgi:hypothetical protein